MARRRTEQPTRRPPRTHVRKAPQKQSRKHAAAPGAFVREWSGTIALVLAAVHLLFAYLFFEPQMHNGGDNSAYLALARSLVDGTGYREIYDPAMPLHTQYPPVFPMLLAGLLVLGFEPWIPFKIMIVAFSTAAIVLSYYWMRRKLRPELAISVALLMAVSPGVLGLSHWELSDVPFWAFTIAALLTWERLGPNNTKRLLAAVVLTVIAYFTRSAGLPLLIAAGAWLAWQRRWKQLAIFGAIIVPLAFLWWWRARTQGGVDYVQQFWFVNPYAPEQGTVDAFGLVRRAVDNGYAYLTRHLPLLLIGRPTAIGVALSAAVIILGAAGWVRRLRHAQVSELFLPLYVGLLLAWPATWSGERFLVPALPLLLFYAGESFAWLLGKAWPARVRVIGLATAALIVLLATPSLVLGARWGTMCMRQYLAGDRYACNGPEFRDFFYMAELAGRTLPNDAVILSRKPRLLWAVSGGKKGRNYPMSPEPDSLFAAARTATARYVLLDRLDRLSQAYLMPAILGRPDAFCVFYGLGPDRAALLGIRPEAERSARTISADSARQGVQFEPCGVEYWRSAAVRDSVFR